jgi:hypothetical protein
LVSSTSRGSTSESSRRRRRGRIVRSTANRASCSVYLRYRVCASITATTIALILASRRKPGTGESRSSTNNRSRSRRTRDARRRCEFDPVLVSSTPRGSTSDSTRRRRRGRIVRSYGTTNDKI